ncbi:hypothetical protein OCF84_21680 (plasmid) [Shewanella xiamenensis]|uniref:Uncharacterized protein n=1 Tax=Shewanella xiamenensis TaxID=332186 RepID=A0ABT6UFK4_9GAMM|nr:hypothetical protein [Shewanella xiamenensis]MDI5832510.1 hypothetical protein [Shewanella xiamenensis]WHF57871.1 hypothetical protein OCF84_21680 [Shewanella xiamenensis]
MFMIEKAHHSSMSALNAKFVQSESHLWVPAWKDANVAVRDMNVDDAIAYFKMRVTKVRNCAYRLRYLGQNVVVSAVNANGAALLDRFVTYALEFADHNPSESWSNSTGVVITNNGGSYHLGGNNANGVLAERLNTIAHHLSSCIKSHTVEIRTNSNGLSGGVWLVTTPIYALFGNTDVGIATKSSGEFVLSVAHKFLLDGNGNTKNPITGKLDYRQNHLSLNDALVDLKRVARKIGNN